MDSRKLPPEKLNKYRSRLESMRDYLFAVISRLKQLGISESDWLMVRSREVERSLANITTELLYATSDDVRQKRRRIAREGPMSPPKPPPP